MKEKLRKAFQIPNLKSTSDCDVNEANTGHMRARTKKPIEQSKKKKNTEN